MKAQSSVLANAEINDQMTLLRLYLQDSANCTAALGGGNQKYDNPQLKIFDPFDSNQVLLEKGKSFGKWSVENLKIDSTHATNPGTWIGAIQLVAEKGEASKIGGSTLSRSLPVTFVTNNLKQIIDCSSTGDLSLFNSYELGRIDVEGWATYNPAGKGTLQSFSFSGSCKPGFIAVGCLVCVGAGCTPSISLYDSNSHTTVDYMGGTNDESNHIQHITLIDNPTPAHPNKRATCTLTKNITFHVNTRNTESSYVTNTSNIYYYRVAPICIRP
jgi:hypothetical protein